MQQGNWEERSVNAFFLFSLMSAWGYFIHFLDITFTELPVEGRLNL